MGNILTRKFYETGRIQNELTHERIQKWIKQLFKNGENNENETNGRSNTP